METILLSLVVPIYNVQDFILECLESIYFEIREYNNVEVILIDDGSEDASMVIALNYIAGDNRFKIIRQENSGLSKARNKGLESTQGRFIWFIDSDDTINKGSIYKVLNVLNQRKNINALCFNYCTSSQLHPPARFRIKEGVVGGHYLLSKDPVSMAQCYVYERSFLYSNKLLFEPNIYHEDALFTSLFLSRDPIIYHIKYKLYNYRIREGSIMATNATKHFNDLVHIYTILLTRYNHEKLDVHLLSLKKTLNGLFYYWKKLSKKERLMMDNYPIKRPDEFRFMLAVKIHLFKTYCFLTK